MEPALQAVLAAMGSFFVASVILAALFVICKGASKNRRDLPTRAINRVARTRTAPNVELSSIEIGESASFDPDLHQISMTELLKATRDFSPELIIGDGSFGLVYRAKLYSGVVVAVKKLSPDAFQGFREFRAEMETLGKIRHPNIVQMLGYCVSGLDRVLIYEFIEKGSLDQWLYDTSSSTHSSTSVPWTPLSWETRIKIIKGVANALAYMHNLDPAIIHRDIKASNVLLDTNFEAHVADFGLARRMERSHSHVSTQVAGTMGYMPPEYFHGAPTATMMGDVYSFGVLTLEILTGRRPNFPFTGEDGKEIRLIDWVNKMVEEERYMEMVDSNISRETLSENTVKEAFKIGTKCANESGRARPSSRKVVEMLQGITT